MANYSAEAKRNRSAAASRSMTTVAEHRKCPRCLRKAALSERVRHADGSARRCNYCGHEVGITMGQAFGYDVTPEPGAKSR